MIMHLPDNTLLQGGKYRIVRFINAGGFGCTYEGVHTMMDSRVAIKEFFVKDFCNREANTSRVTLGTQSKAELLERLRRKFIEEAKAVFKMRHANIVRVTDIFEENGTAYYVMDYIDGCSLKDMVDRQGALPEQKALKYIQQTADALRYVHSLNRLHLDIKPGNIMVDRSDNVYLIDFGTSKQYDEAGGENTSTIPAYTPGYAPIEQSKQNVKTFSPATDIYALGATFYKLLTGLTPPNAVDLIIEDETLAPLPSYISKNTRTAVENAMQLRRKDRTQDVKAFLADLSLSETTEEAAANAEDMEAESTVFEEARPGIGTSAASEKTIPAADITGITLFAADESFSRMYYYSDGCMKIASRKETTWYPGEKQKFELNVSSKRPTSLEKFTGLSDSFILCYSNSISYLDALRFRKKHFKPSDRVRLVPETEFAAIGCMDWDDMEEQYIEITLPDGFRCVLNPGSGVLEILRREDYDDAEIHKRINIATSEELEKLVLHGGMTFMYEILGKRNIHGDWVLLSEFRQDILAGILLDGKVRYCTDIVNCFDTIPLKYTKTIDVYGGDLFIEIGGQRFTIDLTEVMGQKPDSIDLTADIDTYAMVRFSIKGNGDKQVFNVNLIDLIH